MPLSDFLKNFDNTTICTECDDQKYKHSSIIEDMSDKKYSFYKF